jgi:hypothetical protein
VALLAWVMMGIALWHFTVFLPDRFWAGIVGAFLGALLGSIVSGLAASGFTLPSQDDTDILTAVEAIPGAVIGMGLIYLLGVRQGKRPFLAD